MPKILLAYFVEDSAQFAHLAHAHSQTAIGNIFWSSLLIQLASLFDYLQLVANLFLQVTNLD